MRAAPVFVPLAALVIASVMVALGCFTGAILGMPSRIGLPPVLRAAGALAAASGLSILGWVFKYRGLAFFYSTYVTFLKAVRRVPLTEAGRAEPLIVAGPHRHVRHPAYSAYLLLFLGAWLALDWSPLLLGGLYLFLWFQFVITPVEERELKVLFGPEYESYARRVPKFIPAPWRGKSPAGPKAPSR